jgi:hypothetical protein
VDPTVLATVAVLNKSTFEAVIEKLEVVMRQKWCLGVSFECRSRSRTRDCVAGVLSVQELEVKLDRR